MSLFDAYIMVDWSATNKPRGGKADCIWIAHGKSGDESPACYSPNTRDLATTKIGEELEKYLASCIGRILLCFDFPYGYPAGFASFLRTDVDAGKPAWRIVWDAIEDELDDDIGTLPGRIATNRSNRFAVASNFNARVARGNSTGPFWCQANKGEFTNIPQCRPDPPFAAQSRETKDGLRLTDRRAESTSPFRLFGTGSVGSQILTGIPRLAALRFDEGLAKCSSVWPFETGWAAGEDWPGRDIRIVHAEIYPTIREQDDDLNKLSCGEPGEKPIKDRRQVRTMWHWAKRLDSDNKLWREFAIPHGIAPGSREDEAIRSEEGWILGCPPLDSDHR